MHFMPYCISVQCNVDLEYIIKMGSSMGVYVWPNKFTYMNVVFITCTRHGLVSIQSWWVVNRLLTRVFSNKVLSRNFFPMFLFPVHVKTANSPELVFSIAAHLPMSVTCSVGVLVTGWYQFFLIMQ